MIYRTAGPDDVPALVDLFYDTMPWAPERTGWEDGHAAWLRRRFTQAVELDAGGTWVADDGERLLGTGCGHVREGIWVLTLLGVRPEAQSTGIGRELFNRAFAYGTQAAARARMVAASDDTRGWRLYAGAGLDLHPCIEGDGAVRRERIPAVNGVRDGGAEDLEHCAAIDRAVRGGARTPDLELLLELGGRLHLTRRGYAIAHDDRLSVLAAEDEEEATALLWTALAGAGEEMNVAWVTAAQQWAVRVLLASGIPLRATGPYMTGGALGPLRPWLPHGAFL